MLNWVGIVPNSSFDCVISEIWYFKKLLFRLNNYLAVSAKNKYNLFGIFVAKTKIGVSLLKLGKYVTVH